MEKNKYYVYEWYRKDTGETFYVGKGCKRRYKSMDSRNQLFLQTVKNFDCDVRIIKHFDDEKQAFKYEAERIEELKKDGQCICNIHSGGAGGIGDYWTDSLRHEYSVNNPMKDPLQRERMSKNNPMKNPEIAMTSGKKHRRAVIIGDTRYDSVFEAANKYNTYNSTIQSWCNKGINMFGELCRYEDSEQILFEGKRYNKGGSKAIIYKGVEYEAVIDLANELGHTQGTINSWLKRGFDPDGNPCRYIGDNNDYEYVNAHVKRNKNRAKPVIINGKWYRSVAIASEELEIPKSTLYSYLQGVKYNPNCICTYDNQQPIHGNTE